MSENQRDLVLYSAAGIVYVALGIAFPELLFSWFEGFAFLVLAVVVLPALFRRGRRVRRIDRSLQTDDGAELGRPDERHRKRSRRRLR